MGTSASAVSPVPRHRKQFGWVDAHGVDADSVPLYRRQRWYDPTLQRFISRAPIGLSGGANLYEYAGGNPSNWSDPLGLTLWDRRALVLAIIAFLNSLPVGVGTASGGLQAPVQSR